MVNNSVSVKSVGYHKLEVRVDRVSKIINFGNHTHNPFILSNHNFLIISWLIKISNLKEFMTIFIKECEANNVSVISGVDPDTLDLIKCILWYHMTSTASWPLQISLVSPCSIGEDEVKGMSITVFLVVLKANKGVNHSTLSL